MRGVERCQNKQVSHVADDPPGSAHRHPNKENKSEEKYSRQSGRVVTLTVHRTNIREASIYSVQPTLVVLE